MADDKTTAADERLYPVTWDEVKEVELDDALRATPAQRLAWLEEAMKLAWMAGATQGEKESIEEKASQKDMEAKAVEFVKQGAEIYRKE
jgi:hypothetical protein